MRQVLGCVGLLSGVALAIACGGNVVVDPTGAGGSGGAGSTTTTSSHSQGGSGASCPVPSPAGNVFGCSGSVVSTGSGPSQCDSFYCDDGGNTYTESCSGQGCSCQHNGLTLCSCAIDGSGDICLGTAEPCCPFPFAH
jgi:hypothetical protein